MATSASLLADGSLEGVSPQPVTSRLGLMHLQDCVHCGLCLPSCPTYLTTGVEMSSPRGRIAMVRALGEGRAGFSPEFVKHLDQCLGCLACQTACPSGVVYGHALEEAREVIELKYERRPGDRRMRWLLVHTFPYPQRLRWVLHGLLWYQRLGLSRLVRATKLLSLVSRRLAQMEALLPPVPRPREWRPLPEMTPAFGPRRGRVALLTGCAQRFLLPHLNRATVRVLAAGGYDVFTPTQQGCCGALHLHSGDLAEGRRLARALIETFERGGVDFVIANAAGCGAAMKEYGHLLVEEAEWRDRAEAFSAKVRDVSEVLAGIPWNGSLRRLPVSVTYHEACHLAHAQNVRAEPRSVLRQIPGIRLVELAESDVCCGSAGIYNLLQPGMARQLLARKVERIRDADTDFVAAGNIGCLLQLQLGLTQAGSRTRAIHPVELLDWSLHGVPQVDSIQTI
jgi:glycolate oxidase iron-sulfur subunit